MKKKIFTLCISFLTLASCANTSLSEYKYPHSADVVNPDNEIIISFDANGGVISGQNTLKLQSGVKYSSFKDKVPPVTRIGATRKANPWYYSLDDTKVEVNDNTTFNSSTTLYANWFTYDINFDPGEGTWIDGSKVLKTIKDTTYIHLDDIETPICVGKKFEGWYINDSKVSFPYTPNANVTLKAKYTTNYVYLGFLSIDGYWESNTKHKIIAIPYGTTWGDIKDNKSIIPTDPLYSGDKLFSRWNINDQEIPLDYKFTESALLTATYENAISLIFDVNTNGGAWESGTGSTKEIVSPKIKLSTNPTFKDFKDAAKLSTTKSVIGSYELLGWFNESYATNDAIKDSDLITSTSTYRVYAYYKVPHTITFTGVTSGYSIQEEIKPFIRKDNLEYHISANAGYTLTDNLITVEWNEQVRTKGVDYDFVVNDNDGVLTINNAPGYDVTITLNPTLNDYSITYVTDIGVASHTDTSIGTYTKSIKIDATNNDGYTLNQIVVKEKDSGQIVSTFAAGNSFTMPHADVVVNITSTPNVYTITPNKLTGIKTLEYTTPGTFATDITVNASCEEGYTLGKIVVTNTSTGATDFTINSGESFKMPSHNITITANCTINDYKLTLVSTETEGHIYKKDTTQDISSIDVTYLNSILDTINSNVTPYHPYGELRGWSLDGGTTFISSSQTMPHEEKTIKVYWNKYNFKFVDAAKGSVSGTTEYNQVYLKKDDISDVVVTPAKGYSFTNKYQILDKDDNEIGVTDFSTPVAPAKFATPLAHDALVKLKPIIEVNSYRLSFNSNGGTLSSDNPINVNYDEKILDQNLPTATHSYAVFKGWGIDDSDTPIDSTTTMPDKNITLKALWKTSTINVSAVNGTVNTSSFTNRFILHDDEFVLTPTSGYKLDHYEYSFDNTNWTKLTDGMPFKPFVIKSDLADGATVYLKAVCLRSVEVILDGNGGNFSTGEDFLVINVEYNKTWGDIASTLPTSTTKGTIDYWMDGSGNAISSSKVITSTFIARAHYSGGQ